MGGICISPAVSNINLHKSWNPSPLRPWLTMYARPCDRQQEIEDYLFAWLT